jgi:hypothetical protein
VDNNINSWIVEPQILYKTRLYKGNLSALVGSSIQETDNSRQLLYGTGYSSDAVLGNINAATSISTPPNSTIASVYKYNAIFGRLNYNLNDKYIINLTARRDGSSRFGSNNQLHNFGAIGMAWIFSNEYFAKNRLRFLSFGKLKGSYGTTGSDQIGNYQFMNLYDNNNPPIPYRGGASLVSRDHANPSLQWEETKKISIGLDLGFLKDDILLSANYFRNRSSNQLLISGLPTMTGPPTVTINLPATVQNTGLEISLNTNNISHPIFKWSTNFNITIPRNKLLSFKGDSYKEYYADDFIVGKPISFIRLYNLAGVNKSTGRYEFISKDAIRVEDPGSGLENKTIISSTAPTFYGGFGNSVTFKNLQLDILFQFVKQIGPNYFFGTGSPGFGKVNQPISVLDRWENVNNNGKIQRFAATDFDVILKGLNVNQSNVAWSDASYLRLKNISLSWNISNFFSSHLNIKGGRLYVLGQNLFTVTKYKGLDPETKSSFILPPLRVISIGVQITL